MLRCMQGSESNEVGIHVSLRRRSNVGSQHPVFNCAYH